MTREEFVRFVAEDFDKPIKHIRDATDIVTEGLCRAIEEGNEEIQLIGFGTFEIKHRNARKGRNATTGEIIDIPAKNTVHFKPGKYIREAVDTGFNIKKKRGARHT